MGFPEGVFPQPKAQHSQHTGFAEGVLTVGPPPYLTIPWGGGGGGRTRQTPDHIYTYIYIYIYHIYIYIYISNDSYSSQDLSRQEPRVRVTPRTRNSGLLQAAKSCKDSSLGSGIWVSMMRGFSVQKA